MKLGRKYLWMLLMGTLIPLTLVTIEVAMGGLALERFFSFSHFLSAYWFAIALAVWMAMVPLASLHALMNPMAKWWQRITWVVAFLLLGPISIPIYCLVCLRNSAWPTQSPA